MNRINILSVLLLLLPGSMKAQMATFHYFCYQGEDVRFQQPINKNREYFNPIIAGFHPDPSFCKAGDTYYLVNSSFSYFPGVPIYESKDLIHWWQIGHVLDRISQDPLDHQNVSGGIFAPAISYNSSNKTFYMITTNVGKGNFFVKTKNPEKGWSDPIYLPQIDGIDPSFFFDRDGQGYIVHNAPVCGTAAYEGQRAIRIFRFDVEGDSIIGKPKEIIRGGTHVDKHPVWIEGPHLYRIGKYYYLMCAEGGTGTNHSEVIFRARHPMGPWEEDPENPILTQREGVDPDRADRVTSTGHADLLESKSGDWWAVFLGCRPYRGDLYNTGRETFLLPVTWKNGWPVILKRGKAIPTVNEMHPWQWKITAAKTIPVTGNFTFRDDFHGQKLNPCWTFLRNPSSFYTLGQDGLKISALPVAIWQDDSPSALFYRQQHTTFNAETEVVFSPENDKQFAGFCLFQNEQYNFTFGKTEINNRLAILLTRTEMKPVMIATVFIDAKDADMPVKLKIHGEGQYYDFYYSLGNGKWKVLARGVDASNLSTHESGGFVGTMIGLYASK
ncbi:MAG: glycoside hydrolase family 43 protein [Prevotella sp.]|jgi:alpha-N-arabinofuranosidase|nr:glycoside hydrolase family 43 protein [Prevotella sp.]MCI1290746.1 glycoside hydrolase family 43 protein [Prevotella sp.]MCI1323836.1 glycoside hydrolase family 43 protein [Prevotella sp.]MCI1348659.1 glycoside hydrolase family 43 protein [Prevotella sp.]